MIRTENESKNAQKRLEQEKETLQRQQEKLEEMDLSEQEIRRTLGPLISSRDPLREEIETSETMRRGDLSALHDLRRIGRWLVGARIAKGWSLNDLADALDGSVLQVSRDETTSTRASPPSALSASTMHLAFAFDWWLSGIRAFLYSPRRDYQNNCVRENCVRERGRAGRCLRATTSFSMVAAPPRPAMS